MNEKKAVNIAGKMYSIIGSNDREYIKKIAGFVDEKMTELMDNNRELSTERAAVLAAINITADLFKAEENANNLRAQVGQLISSTKK
ncbi:MAG: cell division protein ZapA [Oscillospiraceae bacterium]|nr:cell division protein ZapA [Oscillospiraceae bacterium]